MGYQTLVSCAELVDHMHDPEWVILDCRFSLTDVARGYQDYLHAHIPGAQYAHLDEDLCGPVIKGVTGRHPLPAPEEAAEVFSKWGITPGVQVVAYDDQAGALAAVRAWWMLRWLGHTDAAILDGGWQAWERAGFSVRGGSETCTRREFVAAVHPELAVSTAQVELMRHDPAFRVFDSRLLERYTGDTEPIDPVGGHIPGAYSAPFSHNLTPEGTFRSVKNLRTRFERLLEGTPAEGVVFYCGSGVTSIHNILAMLHAGLVESRLYVGSWSEWIADRQRPVALGEKRG